MILADDIFLTRINGLQCLNYTRVLKDTFSVFSSSVVVILALFFTRTGNNIFFDVGSSV
jgi:hypothetical protein